MLQLKNIIKTYVTGDLKQDALKGVSISFRENEFVSVLGQSGSGKTTMLNLIGGLDRYSHGDLIINGVSTKKYKDADWDIYRNQSIGFVFQSYNLIPHQTVLSNVELALTLAGVSKKERRDRAVAVLEKVGLGSHIHKKPNQMSGGQMQRVAIARALINNPDILLADEPTGALDSETSIQIMELLKEIAKDKLVIMVTHNPELAEKYSTRIVELLDGKIVSDSNPCEKIDEKAAPAAKKKISMSFFTALSLSFNNLKTKKGRTILTSFAGSIGIIGIALILSLSSGMQAYIANVEEDALSSYPITIQSQSIDLLGTHEQAIKAQEGGDEHGLDKIYQKGAAADILKSRTFQIQNNDLGEFKAFLDSSEGKEITDYTNSIKYGYDLDLQIYKSDLENGITQVNPSPLLEDEMASSHSPAASVSKSMGFSNDIWTEMLENKDLLSSQYDILAGSWPSSYNEVVIIVDEKNEISDMTLYALGLKDEEELKEIQKKIDAGEEADASQYKSASYTFDELLNLEFKLLPNTSYYEKSNGIWVDKRKDNAFLKKALADAESIKIVGILRPSEEAAAASITGTIGYTSDLTKYLSKQINDSQIVKEQMEASNINAFTGNEFVDAGDMSPEELIATLSNEQKTQLLSLPEEERSVYLDSYAKTLTATYESNLADMGVIDLDKPSSVNLYLKDFEARDGVIAAISDYNSRQAKAGHDAYIIEYNDMVGLMTSSITDIINMITYLLIGFVSISLVVSSIMIGIITYISVLERTKEIGILRSIGASKRDISRVFNAETIIVGLTAGLIGIGITLALTLPANAIIKSLSGVSNLAVLPVSGAIVLIAISVILTAIAGLIPSRLAAKKDPVIALRTE